MINGHTICAGCGTDVPIEYTKGENRAYLYCLPCAGPIIATGSELIARGQQNRRYRKRLKKAHPTLFDLKPFTRPR